LLPCCCCCCPAEEVDLVLVLFRPNTSGSRFASRNFPATTLSMMGATKTAWTVNNNNCQRQHQHANQI
jgi:hypothetical protein